MVDDNNDANKRHRDSGINGMAERKGPWRCQSCRDVYDNPWITLSHENVITPAGTPGIYGVVHFKHRALGVVPLDADNNTWLVGQFRYALNQFCWEIPMGGGRLDEDSQVAAARELREETGLVGGQWTKLFAAHVSNSVTDEQAGVFLVRDLQQEQQQLEPTEQDLIVKKLPFSQALAMVLNGDITDLISMAALLAVDRHLRTQG